MLYSGDVVIAHIFSWNGPNYDKCLIDKPLRTKQKILVLCQRFLCCCLSIANLLIFGEKINFQPCKYKEKDGSY